MSRDPREGAVFSGKHGDLSRKDRMHSSFGDCLKRPREEGERKGEGVHSCHARLHSSDQMTTGPLRLYLQKYQGNGDTTS